MPGSLSASVRAQLHRRTPAPTHTGIDRMFSPERHGSPAGRGRRKDNRPGRPQKHAQAPVGCGIGAHSGRHALPGRANCQRRNYRALGGEAVGIEKPSAVEMIRTPVRNRSSFCRSRRRHADDRGPHCQPIREHDAGNAHCPIGTKKRVGQGDRGRQAHEKTLPRAPNRVRGGLTPAIIGKDAFRLAARPA